MTNSDYPNQQKEQTPVETEPTENQVAMEKRQTRANMALLLATEFDEEDARSWFDPEVKFLLVAITLVSTVVGLLLDEKHYFYSYVWIVPAAVLIVAVLAIAAGIASWSAHRLRSRRVKAAEALRDLARALSDAK